MKTDRVKEILIRTGKALWGLTTQNFGLKILAVVLALMLWSYVISSNSNITRVKTHTGLQGYMSGQSALDAYNLSIASDPTEALSNITVDVEVPLASYSYSTGDNVKVQLDLSSVRTAGTQEVPLKATTSYGTVKRIYPSSVTMVIEPRDSRSIPINVDLSGAEEGYWYNCARVNPAQVTIYGATSIVQDISSIVVVPDLTDRTASFSTSYSLEFRDKEGNLLPASLLSRSSSSASLAIEVYPTKDIPISLNVNDVLDGEVADGYTIESITVQPGIITVAAEQELLDSLATLVIDPIEVDSPSQSFTRKATISSLSGIKNMSSEQVYVNVQIVEEQMSKWFEDVHITYIGKADGLTLTSEITTVSVRVTGPRSAIDQFDPNELSIVVDLTGLPAGEYMLTPSPDEHSSELFSYQVDPVAIKVSLAPTEQE